MLLQAVVGVAGCGPAGGFPRLLPSHVPKITLSSTAAGQNRGHRFKDENEMLLQGKFNFNYSVLYSKWLARLRCTRLHYWIPMLRILRITIHAKKTQVKTVVQMPYAE